MAHNNIFKYGLGYYGNRSQNCPQDGPDSCCSQLPTPIQTVPKMGFVYTPFSDRKQDSLLQASYNRTAKIAQMAPKLKPFTIPRDMIGVL